MDNFREWVSDNLRYIMLICAIAIVFIGIFFGVRAITGRMSAGNSGAENTGAGTTVTGIPAEEIESGIALAESGVAQTENKIPEISGLVTTYYMALNSKNVESVRAISDNLTEQDVKDIEKSETEYSNIKSYVKQGPEKDDSSYVVYASYEYINPSLYVKHPGLSWLYVKRDDAGEYKIVVDASSDEKLTAYVNEISAEDEREPRRPKRKNPNRLPLSQLLLRPKRQSRRTLGLLKRLSRLRPLRKRQLKKTRKRALTPIMVRAIITNSRTTEHLSTRL